MSSLILLMPVLGPLVFTILVLTVLHRLKSIHKGVDETNRLLQSLIDLQRTALGRSSKADESAENRQGSSEGRGEIVHQIESYGDLSRVGLLKKPKT